MTASAQKGSVTQSSTASMPKMSRRECALVRSLSSNAERMAAVCPRTGHATDLTAALTRQMRTSVREDISALMDAGYPMNGSAMTLKTVTTVVTRRTVLVPIKGSDVTMEAAYRGTGNAMTTLTVQTSVTNAIVHAEATRHAATQLECVSALVMSVTSTMTVVTGPTSLVASVTAMSSAVTAAYASQLNMFAMVI